MTPGKQDINGVKIKSLGRLSLVRGVGRLNECGRRAGRCHVPPILMGQNGATQEEERGREERVE